MLEAYGNIWDLAPDYDAVVITTNGFVKKNGEAVMGRGVALEAKTTWPWLPKSLGTHLKENGNIMFIAAWDIEDHNYFLVTMPVKPEYGPNGEPGWKEKADIRLIEESAKQLVEFADKSTADKIILPRPGCGNGGLKWEDVKPVIEPLLDDRFTVVTFHP